MAENERVYIGHRYVPKVMGEWTSTLSYEGLSIVVNEGDSYTSKKMVPIGIALTNDEYWVVTGNYNAQIESYRKEVKGTTATVLQLEENSNTHLDLLGLSITKKGIVLALNVDVYSDIQNVIDTTTESNIIFPKDSRFTLSEPLNLGNSLVTEIDFNGAVITAPNGGIVENRNYLTKPTIKNVFFNGLDRYRGKSGIAVGTTRGWGASINLVNVRVSNYAIGYDFSCVFNVDTKQLKAENCIVGLKLHKDYSTYETSFSNVNSFDTVYLSGNTYGLQLKDSRNISFTALTIDNAKIGLILGERLANIKINDVWFEVNSESNVSFGDINTLTGVLTKSTDARALENIVIDNVRFNQDSLNIPMFDNAFPETRFYTFGNKLSKPNEKFEFASPNYKNDINFTNEAFGGISNELTSFGYAQTPFGNVKLSTVTGIPVDKFVSHTSAISAGKMKLNDVVLMRMLVKVDISNRSEHVVNLMISDVDGNQAVDGWNTDVRIPTNEYCVVDKIVRITKSAPFETQKVMHYKISPNLTLSGVGINASYDGQMSVSVGLPMFVNLTTVFGAGKEPSNGMESIVSPLFPFKHSTNSYFLGRYKGEQRYDETDNVLKFWNGTVWQSMGV